MSDSTSDGRSAETCWFAMISKTLNAAAGILLPVFAVEATSVGTVVCVSIWVLSALSIALWQERDYFSRPWIGIGILAAMIVLYLIMPKDPSLLPLLASCASVIPKAAMDATERIKLIIMEWKHGPSPSTPDARARLMSNVEEGRGFADNSDFRIDSESEDDTDLPGGSSPRTAPGANRHADNAGAARRDVAPGAADPL